MREASLPQHLTPFPSGRPHSSFPSLLRKTNGTPALLLMFILYQFYFPNLTLTGTTTKRPPSAETTFLRLVPDPSLPVLSLKLEVGSVRGGEVDGKLPRSGEELCLVEINKMEDFGLAVLFHHP